MAGGLPSGIGAGCHRTHTGRAKTSGTGIPKGTGGTRGSPTRSAENAAPQRAHPNNSMAMAFFISAKVMFFGAYHLQTAGAACVRWGGGNGQAERKNAALALPAVRLDAAFVFIYYFFNII